VKSPLYDWHVKHGAKLADFGGWDMPIEYPKGIEVNGQTLPGGTIAEHCAVRERVGIFDVSHLGKISVIGSGAKSYLNTLVTNDLNKIEAGQAQYNLMCNDSGGVIDDLIVYEFSPDSLFLVPNASNCSTVEEVVRAQAPQELEIQNEHRGYGVLAIQGPKAKEVLSELGIKVNLDYMSFTKLNHQIFGDLIICRTGYTGEFGYELIPKWDKSEILWENLVGAVAKFNGAVCGLGARDTLRTEMGYPLHGHELSLQITPIQASASWAVVLEKDEFNGKEALASEKAAGAKTAMRAIKIADRGIPRAGMQVLSSTGAPIGVVTSGTFSPTLKVGIALALISPEFKPGGEVQIDIRGRISSGAIVKLPFVESHVK
jgi:aminomethyltransferase